MNGDGTFRDYIRKYCIKHGFSYGVAETHAVIKLAKEYYDETEENEMNKGEHIIKFDEYCKTCKYEEVSEDLDPCATCLTKPAREETRIPEMWEEKK